MNVAVQRTRAEAALIDAFPAFKAQHPAPDWLARRRDEGYSRFAATGLPHRRIEEWKWTDLRRHLGGAYVPAPASPEPGAGVVEALMALSPFTGMAAARLVFVDGRFDAQRSELPSVAGLTLMNLAELPAEAPAWLTETLGRLYGPDADPIAALNSAFLSDGAVLHVAAGLTVETPVDVISVVTDGSPHMNLLRNVIVLEEGAALTVIETHVGGPGDYVANAVTEARIGADARLTRVKVQEEGAEAVHLSNLNVELGEGAVLREFTASLGARLSRNQVFVKFRGEGGDASVAGSYMLANKQHCDTTLVVNHAVPNCVSRELFKVVLDDQSHGVFQGKLIVEQYAQKSDAKQQSHGLLLSETAEFDAKPELEIFADDVVCGHGATAGQIDETLMFYLMARGIPEAQAKSLLIAAFVQEAFDGIENDDIRERLTGLAEGWLERRG
ncbi:Fe-S cluster assembly protein SufD [Rhodoligotrophos appendicifer]|uniref:Fe-S cluster assembly protein SufD n=1 Tax=Rhodoligotrophos appendicifer TaxID=987056 RepID=UPI0014782F5B|nr:Fe-S cluster assembly protein SufD [Rhodoligotrophos appendicifer]